jgi:hypothetical protein
MDSRGVTTVVAKLLAFGIVLLYIGGIVSVIYGGAVPEYRSAVGDELGDRVLATVAHRVQGAIPPDARDVSASVSVDLPATLRGSGYVIDVEGRSLVLEHPDDAVGGRVRLALPEHVTSVGGSWESGGEHFVRVERDSGGVVVTLSEGEEP